MSGGCDELPDELPHEADWIDAVIAAFAFGAIAGWILAKVAA